jgi:uncharacterized protein (TIGR02246 family)
MPQGFCDFDERIRCSRAYLSPEASFTLSGKLLAALALAVDRFARLIVFELQKYPLRLGQMLDGKRALIGCFALPICAQQDLQEVMNATNALGVRENELLRKKDAAGIASLFTSDGLLVMLAPQFAFKPGRDAIQKHYQGIIDAGASKITLELKNLELRGNDGVWAAGNYLITFKDKTVEGHWSARA